MSGPESLDTLVMTVQRLLALCKPGDADAVHAVEIVKGRVVDGIRAAQGVIPWPWSNDCEHWPEYVSARKLVGCPGIGAGACANAVGTAHVAEDVDKWATTGICKAYEQRHRFLFCNREKMQKALIDM